MSKPGIDMVVLEAACQRAGVVLTKAQQAELVATLPLLDDKRMRVRRKSGGDVTRSPFAAPSYTFRPIEAPAENDT